MLTLLIGFIVLWLALGFIGQAYGILRTPHVGIHKRDWKLLPLCLLFGPFTLAAAITICH